MHPTVMVFCPKCGVDAEYKCVTASGQTCHHYYHAARIKLAAAMRKIGGKP